MKEEEEAAAEAPHLHSWVLPPAPLSKKGEGREAGGWGKRLSHAYALGPQGSGVSRLNDSFSAGVGMLRQSASM